MQKKVFLLGIISYVIAYFGFAFSLTLNFDLVSNLMTKFNSIHFNTPGNNFLGTLFLTNTEFQPQNIKLGTDVISCTNMFQGYYYNSQRGDRVRPLDKTTLHLLKSVDDSYDSLSITGGLYTLCSGDEHGIYGQITYNRSGTLSNIIAGVELDYNKNMYKSGAGLSKSFQRFNAKVPIGYIWDSVGGMGFVGGVLSGSENLIRLLNSGSMADRGNSINDLFMLSGTTIVSRNTGLYTFVSDNEIDSTTQTENALLGGLCIQGMASLSCSDQIQSNVGAYTYGGSSNFVSIKDVLNQERQTKLKTCNSYKNNITASLPSSSTDPYLCYINQSYNSGKVITIDLQSNLYKDKKIVVKNTDVKLINSMDASSSEINIFIDNGNLILANNPANKQSFDGAGYISATSGVTSGTLLKGTVYVNGLILGESGGQISAYGHKLYFFGKLASLNTPCDDESRKSQIDKAFNNTKYSEFVNLQKVFTWACGPSGIGTDGVSCGSSADTFSLCSVVTRK